MKKNFSKTWNSSKQPRKQRKYRYNAPQNIKRKFLSASLSKELKIKHKKRNIPLKKGDTVKILRGQFKKKTGKITKVLTKKSKVLLENISVTKKDGSKSFYPIHASNLQIIELNLEDRLRRGYLTRK